VRNIQCPTLVIRAGQEPAAITEKTIELLRRANPRIDVVTVPEAGHNIHFAHFESFMPLFERFLVEE
jgi:pimeloyl-ACP methyl ester carboxylesterase